MKSSRLWLLSLFILALSCLAIYANTLWLRNEKKPFTIGITRYTTQLTIDTKSLEKILSREILVVYYEDESALLKALYEHKLDAFLINPFDFITHHQSLGGAKAIASLKVDYFLISKIDSSGDFKSVASFDDHISAILINQRNIKQIHISKPLERLAALQDGLVDLIVIESAYYDSTKHQIIEKISSKGYDFNLLVLIEDDQQIARDIQVNLFENVAIQVPDEEKLMRVMNHLFQMEIIKKRIEYSDLVYTIGF